MDERDGYIVVVVEQHSYSIHFCDDAQEAVEISELLGDQSYEALCMKGHSGTVMLAKVVHIDRSKMLGDQPVRNKCGSISAMEGITGINISDFLDRQFEAKGVKAEDAGAGKRDWEDECGCEPKALRSTGKDSDGR